MNRKLAIVNVGKTPLGEALTYGNTDVAEFLRQQGGHE